MTPSCQKYISRNTLFINKIKIIKNWCNGGKLISFSVKDMLVNLKGHWLTLVRSSRDGLPAGRPLLVYKIAFSSFTTDVQATSISSEVLIICAFLGAVL